MGADIMKFEARQIVLLVVDEVGDRSNGKTFIHKLCFFAARLTGHRLGFGPHFYGPYSDDVSGEIAYLVGGGFVDELRHRAEVVDESGWEVARLDYRLTDKGREGIRFLDTKHPAESARVRSAVRQVLSAASLDYIELSLAAKAVWVLEERARRLDPDNIADVAGRCGWPVSGKQVERATEFIRRLDLLEDAV